MKRYRQLITRHCPEEDVYNDSIRTAIGCLMDVPPDAMPHFFRGEAYRSLEECWGEVSCWLDDQYGMRPLFLSIPHKMIWDGALMYGAWHPGLHFIVLCSDSHGAPRAVIYRDDAIVWDPGGSGKFQEYLEGYSWIVSIGANV